MHYHGTIIRWNEKRNFGIILEEISQKEIFAARSDFSNPHSLPQEGRRVSFNIETGRGGREEARNITLSATTVLTPSPSSEHIRRQTLIAGIMFGSISLILAGAYAGYTYLNRPVQHTPEVIPSMVEEMAQEMQEERQAWREAVESAPIPDTPVRLTQNNRKESISRFTCDGRQYCSQMTSKEEAAFFLSHCADTKMDGDHDGIPCESQFP